MHGEREQFLITTQIIRYDTGPALKDSRIDHGTRGSHRGRMPVSARASPGKLRPYLASVSQKVGIEHYLENSRVASQHPQMLPP